MSDTELFVSNKTLYIIRGIPGSGKSSVAKQLCDYIVAADDMPGLYVDGVYQTHLQSASHRWCLSEVKNLMNWNIPLIGVHNVFASVMFMEPYLELAKSFGYAVQVIHCEGVILPSGVKPKSVHNVPEAVISKTCNNWQQFDARLIKPAMDIKDLNYQLENIKLPDAIIFDWERILKFSSITSDEFILNLDLFELLERLLQYALNSKSYVPFFIISNQINKDCSLLEQQVTRFLERVQELFDSPIFSECCFIIDSKENTVLTVAKTQDIKPLISYKSFPQPVEKPNSYLVQSLLGHASLLSPSSTIWIVGDNHTRSNNQDWLFYLDCQKRIDCQFTYVPVSMFKYFVQEVSEN